MIQVDFVKLVTNSRIEFGTVGGTNVSHIKGNLVDLETELRGTTRLQSKCPTLKYQNPCPSGEMTTCQPDEIVIKANPSNSGKILNLEHVHLGSCQLAKYKPTILPEKIGTSEMQLLLNF